MVTDQSELGHVKCQTCGHPAPHHDAGECWTLPDGRETRGETSCSCSWFEEETHTRGTDSGGPDYCIECSERISDWVKWPCPSVHSCGEEHPDA